MSDFNYKRLTPFKWFILENFPFIEADFDALTNWQLFCKLGKEINKIIDSENTLGTQVETLTDFVNNYFDNLDVQDEINNKLDEMAEAGTLGEIINQQIFSELNEKVDDNTEAISSLDTRLSGEITEIERHKYLLVGDSYLQGWTPDGTFTPWGQWFANKIGYTCQIVANGGASFSNYNNSFYSLINNVTDTDFTDVIICGGYNDKDAGFSNVVNGIKDTASLIRTKFPNLKNIYIGMIGCSTLFENTNKLIDVLYYYEHGAKDNNCKYLNGIEFSLSQKNYFSSDGIHPLENGQYAIALNLLNCVRTGYSNVVNGYTSIGITFATGFSGNFTNFGGYVNNNIIEIASQGNQFITASDLTLVANMNAKLKIGTLNTHLMLIGNYANSIINIECVVKNDGLFYDCMGQLEIENGDLYIRLLKINDTNNNYVTFNKIEQLQICPFRTTFLTNAV